MKKKFVIKKKLVHPEIQILLFALNGNRSKIHIIPIFYCTACHNYLINKHLQNSICFFYSVYNLSSWKRWMKGFVVSCRHEGVNKRYKLSGAGGDRILMIKNGCFTCYDPRSSSELVPKFINNFWQLALHSMRK